jgi:hypothetical protein
MPGIRNLDKLPETLTTCKVSYAGIGMYIEKIKRESTNHGNKAIERMWCKLNVKNNNPR